ncbi:MAG: hypothetical protein M3347_15800, partial [Armatimonadota bacterium]|nr:hypothetical protein [Armatimonadota bacterium]
AFTRTLMLGGKKVWTKTTTHNVPPGENQKWDETLEVPVVAARQDGELYLKLEVGGKEVFRDVKAVAVLSPLNVLTSAAAKPRAQAQPAIVTRSHALMAPLPAHAGAPGLDSKTLLVYDPQGAVAAFLKKIAVPFTSLNSLENLPATGKVLVIGKDALDPAESTSSRLAAYALSGKRIIVLEQKNPLKYQALPAEMEAAENQGRTAFIEDATHPALRDLQDKDFFTWGIDEVVYRNAYLKPARGAKSLVQVDKQLQNSALVEVPIGDGLLLLSQLLIGEKLESEAAAQQLLVNMIAYAGRFKLEFRQVAAAIDDAPLLIKALDAMGLQYKRAADPLAALGTGAQIALIEATPANLKTLANNLPKVNAFVQSGGYIVLHGLTPEGLADYNKIVGVEHMIRPFRRERVSFPGVKDPLTAGLPLSDVALYSSERIFPWRAGNYVASDTFSYIVDYDEVAPFGKWNNDFYYNLVNGMTNADAWKYIVNHPSTDRDYILTLPRPETITEFTWDSNLNYNATTRVELIFDGNDANKLSFKTEPSEEAQIFAVEPPRQGKVITIRHAEFTDLPDKKGTIGADNVYLRAKRAPEFYQNVKAMLNIGGMMHYPRGAGGIVLVNLLFKATEELPDNANKKRNAFATILRNLKAPFVGGRTVIAGANLKYTPIDISKQANQYRTERGWFGDANFTLKDLPTGQHKLAGVTYDIFEFATSPVPTAIMLGGRGIPNNPPQEAKGIPVNMKADALFFLHTARIDQRRNDKDIKANKQYEMLRYIVNYADGQSVTIPIYAEIDIDDFKQKEPRAIPGAQIAWTKKYEGTDFYAVAYSKQWNNPRPEAEIKSIDMVYGPDKRGVPVLLAVTAATAG